VESLVGLREGEVGKSLRGGRFTIGVEVSIDGEEVVYVILLKFLEGEEFTSGRILGENEGESVFCDFGEDGFRTIVVEDELVTGELNGGGGLNGVVGGVRHFNVLLKIN
jgi:hypothetical protein